MRGIDVHKLKTKKKTYIAVYFSYKFLMCNAIKVPRSIVGLASQGTLILQSDTELTSQ